MASQAELDLINQARAKVQVELPGPARPVLELEHGSGLTVSHISVEMGFASYLKHNIWNILKNNNWTLIYVYIHTSVVGLSKMSKKGSQIVFLFSKAATN